MKIVRVETNPLFYRLQSPYGDANGIKNYRSIFLFRIFTSSGYSGWGEIVDWLPTLEKGFQDRVIPYLIGKNANDRSQLVKTISQWHQRSASGVSMALLEIFAQSVNRSICDLWGGAMHKQIPLYASFQSYTEDPDWMNLSYRRVLEAVKQGFSSCKVKIGGKKLADDHTHIHMLMTKLDCCIGIILDANQSYDVATAKGWERIFREDSRFLWFEEPLSTDHVYSYQDLRRFMSIAIAGGENLQNAQAFTPFLMHSALDIIQPDINHHESIDQFRTTMELARTFGVRVSPHSFDGPLSRLYSAFALACMSAANKMRGSDIELLEWDCMENPLNDFLALEVVNGELSIPTGIGIGCEINTEVLEKYRWDGQIY